MASNKANLDRVLNSASRKIVEGKGRQVLADAKSLSGAKGSSLRYTVRGNSSKDLVAKVGSTDPGFINFEEGTRPHTIYPKPGNRVLVFPGKGGQKTFATVVHHPGTKGKHPLKKALLRNAKGQFISRNG